MAPRMVLTASLGGPFHNRLQVTYMVPRPHPSPTLDFTLGCPRLRSTQCPELVIICRYRGRQVSVDVRVDTVPAGAAGCSV